MSDSRHTSRHALVLLLASALTVQVWAHGGEDHGDEKKSTPAPLAVATVNAQGQVTFIEPALRLPDGSVFVPKSAQRQLVLRTQTARKGEFPRTVELNGRIVADPNAGGRVQTFQSGRIEAGPKGLAVLGQRVSKGQVLAWLQPASSAIERGSQQAALAELAAQESVLERRVARLRQLEGSVPQKDIEQAQIELAACKKRKAAVGASLGRESLVAPVSGVVSAANAVVGQVIDAREVVFEVIDPQRLAVEALAYDPLLLAGLARASAPVAGGVLELAFVGIGRILKEQAMPVLFRVELPKAGELPALAVGQTLKVLAQTSMQAMAVTLSELEAALKNFGGNTAGGFVDAGGREYLIRNIGRSSRLENLQNQPVATRKGQAILLRQVASVTFAPAIKRGDGSFKGKPAVILSVQKQPTADSVALTRAVEKALAEMGKSLPPGVETPQFLFKQANFIEASVGNVEEALRDSAIMVAVILFVFLANLRRNRRLPEPKPALEVIAAASKEVRSGVVYATLIVVLVFIPLFALPGIEGRLFTPLGVAYIVSILASMAVAMTLTPVLCYYLLPAMKHIDHGDSALVSRLKTWDERLLNGSFDRGQLLLAGAVIIVALALASIPFFPKSFLPPFNEGTLTVSVLLNPGTSLAESNRIGTQAENLLLTVPEVTDVGRRTGRAELDEHAEGVHSSEIEVDLKASERGREAIIADIRQRLSGLPAVVSVGQPISHRLDHLLSGVRAQIALKIFGDDLETLRGLAGDLKERLASIPGIADLQIEKQVLIPQYKIRVDYDAAARYGVTSGELLQRLEQLLAGERVGQILEGNRRFDLTLRLPEEARGERGLENLLIETPTGRVPLSSLATVEDGDGPNQIGRENTRRRIVISANSDGSDMSRIIADIRAEINRTSMPEGYFPLLEGQFQAQEEAARLIAVLALVSLAMIYLVLYSRYRSAVLTAIVMGNVPLALVGSVVALWISGQPLSVAALVGFITLTGIATRNGILKISHYINLCAFEDEVFGRKMIVRGSLERLTPVLMTALVAAFALTPLLLSADAPGKEILHPVAVVIFGGLISSTVLDTLLTPVMFWLFGEKPLQRLLAEKAKESF